MDKRTQLESLIQYIIFSGDKNQKLPFNIERISRKLKEQDNIDDLFYADSLTDQIIFSFCNVYSDLNITIKKIDDNIAEYNFANIMKYKTKVKFENVENLNNLISLSDKFNENIKSFEENIKILIDTKINFIFEIPENYIIKPINFLDYINN